MCLIYDVFVFSRSGLEASGSSAHTKSTVLSGLSVHSGSGYIS